MPINGLSFETIALVGSAMLRIPSSEFENIANLVDTIGSVNTDDFSVDGRAFSKDRIKVLLAKEMLNSFGWSMLANETHVFNPLCDEEDVSLYLTQLARTLTLYAVVGLTDRGEINAVVYENGIEMLNVVGSPIKRPFKGEGVVRYLTVFIPVPTFKFTRKIMEMPEVRSAIRDFNPARAIRDILYPGVSGVNLEILRRQLS